MGRAISRSRAETPVIMDAGSIDDYYRPWRGGSDLDFLDETQSTPIAIEVFEGPPLKVTAAAAAARRSTVDSMSTSAPR